MHRKTRPWHPSLLSLFHRHRRMVPACLVLLVFMPLSGREARAAGTSTMDDARTLDRFIAGGLQQAGIRPAPRADDAEFLRRATLDVIGMIPTAEETEAFLRDTRPDKRARKIDALLRSPLYAENWANIWLTLLIGRERTNAHVNPRVTREWLQRAFSTRMPYDRFVTALLTAEGRSDKNGAVNYLVRHNLDPLEITGSVSKLFLGLPLECAQCHEHPDEQWTQRDFYGMAAFFARVKPDRRNTMMLMRRFRKEREVLQREGKKKRMGPPPMVIREQSYGEVILNVKGREETIAPRFIDGGAPPERDQPRRRAFVRLITSPERPYLSRTLVNRLWAHFFGRGLVEPLDGFSEDNPPSHPELLRWFSKRFVEQGYDLQYVMRTILNTEAYQRTSTPTGAALPSRLFGRALLRPLTAEQTLLSILRATGIEEVRRSRNPEKIDRLKTLLLHKFAFLFNNDEQEEEEKFNGTIPEALMMMNGKLVNAGSLAIRGSRLRDILADTFDPAGRLRRIFLAALSRPPTEAEYRRFSHFRMSPRGHDDRRRYEDLFWALLNSPEFAVNH